MLRSLHRLLPVLAALVFLTASGLQSGRAPSKRPEPSAPAAQVPSPLPTVTPTPVQAPPEELALAHEHLSRVDHLARARILRDLGDLSGALTECRRALFDAPEDEEALSAIAHLGPLAGQTRFAVLALGELGRMESEDASPLIQQARLLISEHQYAEAIRAGEEAVSRDREEPKAYQVLGRAHLAAGHLSEAILRFQQTVHLAPEHGYALNNLGLA
jgi:tetratricopeptide (TPR) repeat protein